MGEDRIDRPFSGPQATLQRASYDTSVQLLLAQD